MLERDKCAATGSERFLLGIKACGLELRRLERPSFRVQGIGIGVQHRSLKNS